MPLAFIPSPPSNGFHLVAIVMTAAGLIWFAIAQSRSGPDSGPERQAAQPVAVGDLWRKQNSRRRAG